MADLDPARRCLVVGERASPDRRQCPVEPDVEGGDGPSASPDVVGVGDEKLLGVRRPELAAKGPSPCAEEGDPGAAVRSPPLPTTKLSIDDEPTRVPTRLLPVELKSTSPGCEPFGRETVELASGCSCPKKFSVNPV